MILEEGIKKGTREVIGLRKVAQQRGANKFLGEGKRLCYRPSKESCLIGVIDNKGCTCGCVEAPWAVGDTVAISWLRSPDEEGRAWLVHQLQHRRAGHFCYH